MLRILYSFWTFLLLVLVSELYAQSPSMINYQAVARNTQTGTELSNQDVFLTAEIRENGPSGSIIYQENHTSISTDNFGLFNIMIGSGNPVVGSFTEIQWPTSTFWLVINIDAGSGLENAGAMQMLSVPYALHANTATDVDDADADPTNELVQDLVFDVESSTLTILQEGDNNPFVNLQPLIAGLDDSDTNELTDSLTLNSETSILTLHQPGTNNPSVDLSMLSNDWESNEIDNYVFNITDQIGIGTSMPSSRLEIKGVVEDTSLLKVVNNEDMELLSIGQNNIGIGGSLGGNKIQMSGSVGYNYVYLVPPLPDGYNVTDEDYLVIGHPSFIGPITVYLPDPVTCTGRKIIIKKIGSVGLSTNLNINTGGANIDLATPNDVISGSQAGVRTYMSIGEQGWIKIQED